MSTVRLRLRSILAETFTSAQPRQCAVSLTSNKSVLLHQKQIDSKTVCFPKIQRQSSLCWPTLNIPPKNLLHLQPILSTSCTLCKYTMLQFMNIYSCFIFSHSSENASFSFFFSISITLLLSGRVTLSASGQCR